MWRSVILLSRSGMPKKTLQTKLDGVNFHGKIAGAIAPDHEMLAQWVNGNKLYFIDASVAANTFYPFLVQLLVDVQLCCINIGGQVKACIFADLIADAFIE